MLAREVVANLGNIQNFILAADSETVLFEDGESVQSGRVC